MELLRILKNKKIMTGFLLLLLAAAGIYYYEQNGAIHELEERRSYMDEALVKEMEMFQPYEERQAAYVSSYQEKIGRILDSADAVSGISIFQNTDSFSNRNISRTKEAYERVVSVEPAEGNYEALEQVLSWDLTGYLIFLFSIILIWDFTEEKKTGLRRIIYASPGGRGKLAARQLGSLAVAVSLFTTAAYGCTFIASVIIYGMPGPWNVSAQSMILLGNYTWPVNIPGYLLLFLLLRIVFAVASAFFVWALTGIFRTRILGLMTVILVYGAEGVLYIVLTDTSPLSFLRYLNVFALITPGDILYEYRNFNLAGTPVNCLAAVILLAVLLAAASGALILVIAERRKPVYSPGRIEERTRRLAGKVQDVFHKGLARLSVPGLEVYKIFVVNKGVIFVVIWLCVFFSQLDFTEITFTGKSLMLNEIYQEYAGPDDGRMREYLDEQEAVISDVEAEYEEKLTAYENGDIGEEEYAAAAEIYSSYSTLISTVEDLQAQISYVENIKEERGITAWIVYEKPYRILWTENGIYKGQGYGDQEFEALCNLLLVIFLVSGIFSYDKMCGIQPVIRCSEKGRVKLFLIRIGITSLICLVTSTVTTVLRLLEINENYPIYSLAAPVQSLRFMGDFPLEISIGGFLAFVCFIRVFLLLAEAMAVLAVTYRLPGTKGLTVSVMALFIPQIVYMLGFEWGWFCSAVQPLVYVEILNRYGFYISMAAVLLVVLIGIICCRDLMIRWCGKRGRYGTKNKKPVKKV